MNELFGKTVVVMCANYIYTGTLQSITHDYIVLNEPSIVYETGEWSASDWKDSQRLPTNQIKLERSGVESHFELIRRSGSGSR